MYVYAQNLEAPVEMKKIINIIDKTSLCGALFASVVILATIFMMLTEIILRAGFSSTTHFANEYSGYASALIAFMGLGYTLSVKGHVRMTLLFKVISGKTEIIWNIIIHLVGLIVSGHLVFLTWNHFHASVVSRTVSIQITQTPLAIPQFFLVLGTAVLTLQFVAEICKLILKLKGDEDVKIVKEPSSTT